MTKREQIDEMAKYICNACKMPKIRVEVYVTEDGLYDEISKMIK